MFTATLNLTSNATLNISATNTSYLDSDHKQGLFYPKNQNANVLQNLQGSISNLNLEVNQDPCQILRDPQIQRNFFRFDTKQSSVYRSSSDISFDQGYTIAGIIRPFFQGLNPALRFPHRPNTLLRIGQTDIQFYLDAKESEFHIQYRSPRHQKRYIVPINSDMWISFALTTAEEQGSTINGSYINPSNSYSKEASNLVIQGPIVLGDSLEQMPYLNGDVLVLALWAKEASDLELIQIEDKLRKNFLTPQLASISTSKITFTATKGQHSEIEFESNQTELQCNPIVNPWDLPAIQGAYTLHRQEDQEIFPSWIGEIENTSLSFDPNPLCQPKVEDRRLSLAANLKGVTSDPHHLTDSDFTLIIQGQLPYNSGHQDWISSNGLTIQGYQNDTSSQVKITCNPQQVSERTSQFELPLTSIITLVILGFLDNGSFQLEVRNPVNLVVQDQSDSLIADAIEVKDFTPELPYDNPYTASFRIDKNGPFILHGSSKGFWTHLFWWDRKLRASELTFVLQWINNRDLL